MAGRTIVITGASDGIGAVAARKLKADGENVVLVGRSPRKTQALADELHVPYFVADFAKLADVRRLAADLRARYPRIDVLANNAGGIFGERTITEDGYEKNFQVNHLAPFLLTNLLLETLLASRATVLNTASIAAARYGQVDINDLNSEHGYKDERAYGSAKIDMILVSKELHAKYHDRGLNVVAFHPGNISSNFGGGSSWAAAYKNPLIKFVFMTSPEKAAKTLLHFIEGRPDVDWTSGEYYHLTKAPTAKQQHSQTKDPVLRAQVWDRSAHMAGIAA